MPSTSATACPPPAADPALPSLPPLFDPPRRHLLLALVGLGLLQAGLAAAAALGVRALFNALGGGSERLVMLGNGPLVPVLALGGGALVAALAMIALRRRAGWLAESLGQQYVAAVRLVLLEHLFRLPPRHHQRMRHGHLMARLTGDLGALHRWTGRTVAPLLAGTASFVLLAATLAWLAPWVALGALLACLPLFGWAWLVSARLERALRIERAQRWALAGQVGERLAEAAVVQANAQTGWELRRLRRRQQRLHDAAVVRAREAALLKALPPAVATLMLGVLAGWGSWQVTNGTWSSGTLAGLLTLLGLVLAPLRDFALGLGGWRNWRVSREKLMSFLLKAPLPANASQAAPQPPGNGLLRLEALTVVPGMVPVTAELQPLATLALQGGSGSGKSALLEAMAGLLVPTAGRVLLDGEDSATTPSARRGRRIALVAADLPLLRGSVAGNLRYRRKSVPIDEMQRALQLAGVRALASGAAIEPSSPVAEGGRNLPRLLRARLALARALVDAPAVLLIDDFDDLLEGEPTADAPLATLLCEPPCTIVIATRRPEWAARCALRSRPRRENWNWPMRLDSLRPVANPELQRGSVSTPAVAQPGAESDQTGSNAPPAPELRRLDDDPLQRYWISRPRPRPGQPDAPTGLLVSVHGISRNAGAHARALAPLADELGLVLVAPHFSRQRFPDYQRMGRPQRLGPGGRADQMLLRIVQAASTECGLPAQPFVLMGHSGGAQFALRFALVHATHVAGYVLSAPGSYCWPDTARRFPHGVAPSRAFADLQPSLAALLQRPGLVLVGASDVERDGALRQGERIDASQGRTRIERAQRWVAAMQEQAGAQGVATSLALQLVAGCGHGFSELARAPVWRDALRCHLASSLARSP